MSEVKRYYVGKYGLVEGEALGRLSVVLAADFDRVTDERDAALGREAVLREELKSSRFETRVENGALIMMTEKANDLNTDLALAEDDLEECQKRLTAADERADRLESGIKWEAERNALLMASLTEAEDILSVTSLEAGQRIDLLEGLLLQTNELLYAIQGDPGAVPSSSIDAMRGEVFTALKPAEVKCKTCNGTRIVSDGAMYWSSGGIPFECGPIECVKDCPDCSKP